jgi:hypothetical protein
MEVVVQPTRSADAQNSLLSMLPGEIRNEIYRLVLLSSYIIVIKPSTIRGQRSLLQSCHQIRKEALKIYYCENTFSVGSRGSSINNITKFLSAKDKSSGRMVSQLTVVHVLGREELVKACLIAAAICGSRDLATAQKIGDELRGMVMKSGTPREGEQALAAKLGTEGRMDFLSINKVFWADALTHVRKVVSLLFERGVPQESIRDHDTGGHFADVSKPNAYRKAESDLVTKLCMEFEHWFEEIFEIDGLSTSAMEDASSDPGSPTETNA